MSIREAKNRLTEIARFVEKGETIVITRNGRPIFDLVPHRRGGGIDRESLEAMKKHLGIERVVEFISPSFDEPLAEDVLLEPFPET